MSGSPPRAAPPPPPAMPTQAISSSASSHGFPPDLPGLFLRIMSGSPRIPDTPAAPPPPPLPAMATDQAAPSSPLWSDGLPPELAGLVIRRLPSLADRARFGAVCRRWGLAAQQQAPTLPAPLPWISNCPTQVFQSFPDGESHDLQPQSAQPIRFLACRCLSESWLMFLRPGSCAQSRFFLKNPLSGATIPLPGNFRSADHRLFSSDFATIRKFIVCSDDDLIVLMARGCPYPPPPLGPLIACCRPGSMSSWSTATCVAQERDYDLHYQDIAFHHGNVYGVNRTGDLYAHSISEDSGTGEMVVSDAKQVIKESDAWFGARLRQFFLVVSRGDLLLVKWIDDEMFTSSFEVFKADLEMSRWSEVSSLGDQALFVSGMCSKAVSTSSHGDYLRGNCIYFMDNDRRGAKICAMYDLRDNIYHKTTGTLQCRSHEPAWFFPHK